MKTHRSTVVAGVLFGLALGAVGVLPTLDRVDACVRSSSKARHVIVDITGVGMMDTRTIQHLTRMVRAADLLGSRCVITGMRGSVAQMLVDADIDVHGIETLHSLEQGLGWARRAGEGRVGARGR